MISFPSSKMQSMTARTRFQRPITTTIIHPPIQIQARKTIQNTRPMTAATAAAAAAAVTFKAKANAKAFPPVKFQLVKKISTC